MTGALQFCGCYLLLRSGGSHLEEYKTYGGQGSNLLLPFVSAVILVSGARQDTVTYYLKQVILCFEIGLLSHRS
jgi:hypothetical protein